MVWLLAGVGAATAVLALALTPLLGALAARRGFVDRPGGRKLHDRPVPYGGGIAIALSVMAVLGAGVACAHVAADRLPAEAAQYAPGAVRMTPRFLLFMACGALMLLLGTVDDARPLSWRLKLFIQLVVGAAFAVGVEPLGGEVAGSGAAYAGRVALTALWIAGVTNLINLMDHMDGVAGGVTAIVSAAFLVAAVQTGQWFIAALLAALAGGCLGFLAWNFPPARVFLGDGGALFTGFFLGGTTTVFTFAQPEYPLYTYFVPAMVLAVPAWDALIVVLRRARERRPLFEGDRTHLCHRLTSMGLSPRSAVLAIYALTLVTGIGAVLLYAVDPRGAVMLLLQTILVLTIWTILERAGR